MIMLLHRNTGIGTLKKFSRRRFLPESLRSVAPSVTQAKNGARLIVIVGGSKKPLTFIIILRPRSRAKTAPLSGSNQRNTTSSP